MKQMNALGFMKFITQQNVDFSVHSTKLEMIVFEPHFLHTWVLIRSLK
jgi:hypothetical protein